MTPRLVAAVAASLAGAALLGAVAFLLLMPSGGGVALELHDAAALPITVMPVVPHVEGISPSSAAGDLVVDVEGAVRHAGLVRVAAGSRVGDALERAGGLAPRADLRATAAALNLAQPVTDGLKIVVPAIGDGAPSGPAEADRGAATAGSARVDLNRATQAELEALPGIGPVTAGHILESRSGQPFTAVDELRSRGLVGESTFGKLRALVTVGR